MSSHTNPQDATPTSQDPLVIRQLGIRLDHIYQWVLTAAAQLQIAHAQHQAATTHALHYTDIWDLCCDHGRLGMHLSQTAQLSHSHIHLVDCVPSILASLHARFSGALNQKLTFTLADAGTIEFMHRGPQAIIVAGVGGRTVVEILQALLARGLPHSLTNASFTDFFISPNSDAFELRRYLKANNFAILKEEFVSENGFHHEHLQLRHGALDDQNTTVIEHTDAGHALWLSLNNDKKKYLNKLLKHHQLSYQFKHLELDREAANAYQKILGRASTYAY